MLVLSGSPAAQTGVYDDFFGGWKRIWTYPGFRATPGSVLRTDRYTVAFKAYLVML